MIRERVSTAGVVSALEPEAELSAMQIPRADVGRFGPPTMQRYLRDRRAFAKRFAHTTARIEKQRRRNLQRAREDTIRRMAAWRMALRRDASANEGGVGRGGVNGAANGSAHASGASPATSPGWGWAWALDDDEAPPPSSLVARRDTEEARRLAAVADEAMLGPAHAFSGNNLWAVVINFLTITPGRETHGHGRKSREGSATDEMGDDSSAEGTPRKSRLRHLRFWDREARGASVKGDGSSA